MEPEEGNSMRMAMIKTNHDWTRSDVIRVFHVLISPERSVEIGARQPQSADWFDVALRFYISRFNHTS